MLYYNTCFHSVNKGEKTVNTKKILDVHANKMTVNSTEHPHKEVDKGKFQVVTISTTET